MKSRTLFLLTLVYCYALFLSSTTIDGTSLDYLVPIEWKDTIDVCYYIIPLFLVIAGWFTSSFSFTRPPKVKFLYALIVLIILAMITGIYWGVGRLWQFYHFGHVLTSLLILIQNMAMFVIASFARRLTPGKARA